jgi:hypothetical protein
VQGEETTPDVFGIGHARLGHSAFAATLADGKLSLDCTWTSSTHLDSALTKLTVERQREADSARPPTTPTCRFLPRNMRGLSGNVRTFPSTS